jgi:DivIVA domain-containing protein
LRGRVWSRKRRICAGGSDDSHSDNARGRLRHFPTCALSGPRVPRYSDSVVDEEFPKQREEESEVSPVVPEHEGGFGEPRERVPAEIRNVSFRGAVRGYDRADVDAYVKRVNRLIAELEMSRSPQAAVRHALDRLGEQTTGILQQARESAEKLTASAREEADEGIAGARAEAERIVAGARAEAGGFRAEAEQIVSDARAEAVGLKAEAEQIVAKARADADEMLARSNAEAEKSLARARAEAAERLQRSEEEMAASREQAEARMRELHAETEAVWRERQELLDEIHGIGARLQEVASGPAARFSPPKPGEPAAGAEAERGGIAATDETRKEMSMVASREQSDREARGSRSPR